MHNWCRDFDGYSAPSLEFVAPTKAYVVVNGQRTYIDLGKVPALSPRQMAALTSDGSAAIAYTGDGAVTQEMSYKYMASRLVTRNTPVITSNGTNAELN